MFGGGYRKFARCLDEQMGDDAVFGDQGEAFGAQTHTERRGIQFKTERFGESTIAVSQHGDALGCGLAFRPGAHHEGVIHRKAGKGITLCGECFGMLDEARQMFRRAGRSEGAGYGKHDDLFPSEKFGGFDGLDAVLEGIDGNVGDGVSDVDCHGLPIGNVVRE